MSNAIDKRIELLLNGERLADVETSHFSDDYSAGSKDTCPSLTQSQKPVTYIVAAVILNEEEEVLMIQEAKPSCKGKWYLPAGRVESNETLVQAVQREVLEETGLIFEPSTLVLIESACGSWFRFVFTGEIVGGCLKSLKEANEESLQAAWVRNVEELDLRSHDVLTVIKRGKSYIENKSQVKHPLLLPVAVPSCKSSLRLIISCKERATNLLHVLATKETSYFPVCDIDPERSLLSTLHNFMVEIFGADVAQHKPHGLLSLEFGESERGSGLCLTLLISFKLPLEQVSPIEKYTWHRISTRVAQAMISRLPKNMTVPINVVR